MINADTKWEVREIEEGNKLRDLGYTHGVYVEGDDDPLITAYAYKAPSEWVAGKLKEYTQHLVDVMS